MGRVLIVGLDGATWDVLVPRSAAGGLGRLRALMERGAWGPLRSSIPPVTPPGWSSFMTGRNPGAHGVFGFRRPTPDRYEEGGLTNAADLRAATLWDIAGHAGKQVGVIGVPPSYPLPVVNGFVVGCMLTPPGEPVASPPDVAAELTDFVTDVRPPLGLRRGQADYVARGRAYLDALEHQTRQRTAVTVGLMRRPWDVLCVVYYAPDRMQHYFWSSVATPGGDPEDAPAIRAGVEANFFALDDALGSLADAAGGDATVVLVSDHGCGPKPARAVYVNRWLADRGWLGERPLWRIRRKVLSKVMSRPRRLRHDTVESRLERGRTRAWAETLDPTTVGVWVNVAGRYPLGCVRPGAEYEAFRRELVEALRALADERGRPVFERVDAREAVYRGPFVEQAPDVIALCTRDFGVIYGNLRRDMHARATFGPFDELGFSGTHDRRGIYLFAGSSIRALGMHDEYPIESIAPTTLHLLGLPVPRSMEGPVCESLLGDGRPVEYTDDDGSAWRQQVGGWKSADDEVRIREHLQALGYVE